MVFTPPLSNAQPFNTGDSTEFGVHPKELVDALNSMLFTQRGATVVDFGAFPGSNDTSATVTGQAAIVAGSTVRAWLVATATSDHSIDEHRVDPPTIVVGNISPGVGFTIYALSRDGGTSYGQWTVQWSWN